jgi:hypothetical protein
MFQPQGPDDVVEQRSAVEADDGDEDEDREDDSGFTVPVHVRRAVNHSIIPGKSSS